MFYAGPKKKINGREWNEAQIYNTDECTDKKTQVKMHVIYSRGSL